MNTKAKELCGARANTGCPKIILKDTVYLRATVDEQVSLKRLQSYSLK